MKRQWKLQDAKSQFSRVVEEAIKHGPQIITKHGTKAVVVLSIEEYEKFTSKKREFRDVLLSCPKMGDDFSIERVRDFPRKIDL